VNRKALGGSRRRQSGGGSVASEALDRFGEIVTVQLRDHALDDLDGMFAGRWKAPAVQSLQREMARLSAPQQETVRRAVKKVVEAAIHDFLFALQEEHEFGRLDLRIDGVDIIAASDGIHGEMFGETGWFTRFSAFGPAAADSEGDL
jgi:hypothetical protein